MIEFDPSEYLNATVTDDTLRLVANFCGKETADKLLYTGDAEWTQSSLQPKSLTP
jgi:hypothetical protein